MILCPQMTFDLHMWPLTSWTYDVASMTQVSLQFRFIWRRNNTRQKEASFMSYDHLKCVLSITIVWRWRSSNFCISFITWLTTLSLWHIMRNLKLNFCIRWHFRSGFIFTDWYGSAKNNNLQKYKFPMSNTA